MSLGVHSSATPIHRGCAMLFRLIYRDGAVTVPLMGLERAPASFLPVAFAAPLIAAARLPGCKAAEAWTLGALRRADRMLVEEAPREGLVFEFGASRLIVTDAGVAFMGRNSRRVIARIASLVPLYPVDAKPLTTGCEALDVMISARWSAGTAYVEGWGCEWLTGAHARYAAVAVPGELEGCAVSVSDRLGVVLAGV